MKVPFTKPKMDKRTPEEVVLDERIEKFANDADTPQKVSQVQALLKNRVEIAKSKGSKIDPNVLISAGVGIVQVCTIVGYERFHAMTSKALSFVQKGRLR